MLSDWSPKTQFLLYSGPKQYKFGGWELYNANKFETSGTVKEGDPVYGYLWHFFDIMIVIQINLTYIFIYSLHYRESHETDEVILLPMQLIGSYLIVWMGNWGGSHGADTATGDLTLTPTGSGSYSSSGDMHTITLTISSAKYKTASTSDEQNLPLDSSGNTLVLTSGSDITADRKNYTLNRGSLQLTLTRADSNLTGKTYNVILNITRDISLTGTCSGCKLKTTTDPYNLGTYRLTSSDNTIFTGEPDSNDYHDKHKSGKCCMYGKQNIWSNESGNNRYGWHSFTILIPLKIIEVKSCLDNSRL